MHKPTWTEHLESRQATKNDLLDIAHALGVKVPHKPSVITLRVLIRDALETLNAQ